MFANRWRLVAVLAACAVSAAVIVAVASAAGSGGRAAMRIHSGWLGTAVKQGQSLAKPRSSTTAGNGVMIHTVFVTRAFRANTGDSGGFDEFAVSGPLRSAGHRIGFGIVRCAVTVPAQGIADCTGVFNLGGQFPKGSQLTIQGMTSDATDWFNAITGGTGRFAEARGQLEAQNIAPNRIRVTFHITH
jgi:hypothetical protein